MPNFIKFAALTITAHPITITAKLYIVYCGKQSLGFFFLDVKKKKKFSSCVWKLLNFIVLFYLSITYFICCTTRYTIRQYVLRRNKCMCSSLHALCYGCVWSCTIHNFFASYDGEFIPAYCTNMADSQWTEALSNMIKQNRHSLPIFEQRKNPVL